MQIEQWVREIRMGNHRSIGRAISGIEHRASQERLPLMEALFPFTGKSVIIGITGAPGAGKSTIVDGLIEHLVKQGQQIGVIAVDPSSPFSGGALLGDRVRMSKHALNPQVFIRSMGTRGKLGGIAESAMEAIHILDAAGFNPILVETVGIGQSEIDIYHLVDSLVLVLTPESGDEVQVFKSGIMESADLFVINKADRQGSQPLQRAVEEMVMLTRKTDWYPPVLSCRAIEGIGIDLIWDRLTEHRQQLVKSGLLGKKQEKRFRLEVQKLVVQCLEQQVQSRLQQLEWDKSLSERSKRSPYQVAEQILEQFFSTELPLDYR